MAKILSIDNMLEAAQSLKVPGLKTYIHIMEAAAHSLALAIAKKVDVETGDTTWEPEFGGLCASFYPTNNKKKCPMAIHRGDPSGDWHVNKGTNHPPFRSYEVQHEFDFEPTFISPLDEGQDAESERSVALGKAIPWNHREVLADVVAEFLSRSKDSR